MMTDPIAFIDVTNSCVQKKVNTQTLYVPPVAPASTFYTMDIGIALAKGSKLTPYLNYV